MILNGVSWVINFVEPNNYMLLTSSGEYTIGACDNNYKAIYINNELPTSLMRKVLCHEIAHAAMFSYRVLLDLEQEEVVADLIATYGWQILCETERIVEQVT